MSKKRNTTSEPMVAAEPPRPEEEISLDQDFLKQEESVVAPPSTRNRASERGSSTRPRASERSRSDSTPSFGARSAKERRAARAAASGSPRRERQEDVLRADVVANLLQNPTRTVSEETLKTEYSYIVADLRSMGVLAAGLIVLLMVLAQVLPS